MFSQCTVHKIIRGRPRIKEECRAQGLRGGTSHALTTGAGFRAGRAWTSRQLTRALSNREVPAAPPRVFCSLVSMVVQPSGLPNTRYINRLDHHHCERFHFRPFNTKL